MEAPWKYPMQVRAYKLTVYRRRARVTACNALDGEKLKV